MDEASANRFKTILTLVVTEAKSRTVPADFVSRLYRVEQEISMRVEKLMEQYRQEERANKGKK
jgi:hypothetical protein